MSLRTSAVFLWIFLISCVPARAELVKYVYPPPESAADERHNYYWDLLEAALASNREKYGEFSAKAYEKPMTFQRAVAEIEADTGRINIVSRATSLELERRMRAVPIPLDKGLLGARLFLVMPETQARLDRIDTLEELKGFSFGLNSAWTDVKIMKAAGFKLALSEHYNTLFSMLGARRFDLLSRGAIEIGAEWRARKESVPGMQIERRFMLYYPMPRYFFVPRTPEGERMAERIADGLNRLRKSGEFERRYQTYKKLVLKDLDLSGRIVFRIPNPELSPQTPLTDKSLWDDLSAETGS